ncbi:beta strand repeat-containing protein [Tenacibaculum agarivorans]|uniref:beta strand repeat-containing protein n=1 Tax=Tenacibaculum agarivorans TaxID=1908389 RepID=UPI00094B9363|nr:hypothetical protein [Tenacibaculum agarivorans]
MTKLKIVSFFICSLIAYVAVGQEFNYQAVVRDNSGAVISNKTVGVQLKIYEGNPLASGTVVYTETHSVTTSGQGIISLSVGGGTTSDTFTDINWNSRNHWLETAIDTNGGTSYIVLGTSQLQSVPYANYAATSGDKSFTTESNVTSNTSGNTTTDDFVFGSSQLASDNTTNDDDRRFFFDKSKGAFRSGTSNDSSWDDANIGVGSAAFGYQNIVADGFNGFSAGSSNTVRASNGVAFGDQNRVTGNYAFAQGEHLTSETRSQITLGHNNTPNVGTQANSNVLRHPEDRLFVIGNGTFDNKSDALTILKNGNTTLNGTLTIDGDNVTGSGRAYTLPAQDGAANQVMSTDGSGNINWVDAGTSGTFSTVSNVTSNALGDIANDNFVFGSSQLDNIPNNTTDNSRMFFNKNKGAFRVGFLSDNAEGGADAGQEWNDANVGSFSIAMGRGGLVKGTGGVSLGGSNTIESNTSNSMTLGQGNRIENMNNSYAIGNGNKLISASSNTLYAHVLGSDNTISAGNSYTLGNNLTTNRWGQMVLGFYNEATIPNAVGFNDMDPFLVIGNGKTDTRSNALVMLRNGNTTLNGQLTIDGDNKGAGAGYTLPAQDGLANQVMSTDGSGNVSWINVAAPGAFSTTANVTSNVSGNIATDDFVFGNATLDANGVANSGDEVRMYFDKSKGAFRVGNSTGNDGFDDYWNAVNVGDYSVAMGRGSVVQGIAATALGSYNGVGGENAFAAGYNNLASRFGSIALGTNNSVSGIYAVGLGAGSQATSYGQQTIGLFSEGILGTHNSYVATDALFVVGNGTGDGNRSNALVMRKNGNTTLNGKLTIDADNIAAGRSYTLPAQDGTANQVMSTDGAGNVNWTNVSAGTTLPTGGTNGQVLRTDGSGNYTWVNDAVNDADNDPTNEIELPTGGVNGQVLRTNGSGSYTWANDAVNDGDYDPTNEIELPAGGTNGQILISDGSGDSQWTSDISTNSVTTNSLKVNSLPSFSADLSGTLVLSGAGSFLEVPSWRTSDASVGNLHDNGNHFDETTGKFTAPEDGLYYFSAQVRFDGINSGFARLLIGIKGQLSLENGMHAIFQGDAGTNYHTLNVSGVMKLSKNQEVVCVVYSSTDTSWSVQSESGFNGYMITRL